MRVVVIKVVVMLTKFCCLCTSLSENSDMLQVEIILVRLLLLCCLIFCYLS